MRKVLSLLIAVCLILSLFTSVFAPVPSAKALGKGHFAYSPVDTTAHQAATITVTGNKTVTALPDPFEPDNDRAHAHDIATDGSLQHHNFADNGDEDWVKFTAVAGMTYTIDTVNLESNGDTMLELYGAPDVIDYNDDDGSRASRIDFECPAGKGGTYYVRIWPYSTYGDNTGYDLRVQPALQVAFSNADNAGKDYGFTDVLNHVMVTVTRGGVPVSGASVNVDWGTSLLTTDASGQTSFTFQKSWEAYSYLQVTSGDSKVTRAYFWVIETTSALMMLKPVDINGYYLTRFTTDTYDLVGGSSRSEWWSGTSNMVTLPTTASASNLAVITAASDEHGGVGYVFTLHPTLTARQKTVLTPSAGTDCVALSLSATLDSEPFMYANVFLRNQAYASTTDLRAAVMDYLGASIVYLTPGTYTAVATKCYADPHVWLTKRDIVASSSTSASIAVTTPQLGTLTCLPLDGSNNPASANYLELQSEGVSTELRTTVSNAILVSPGTYEELNDRIYLNPSGTSEQWLYEFACSATHVMTAGSAVTVTFGGPLTMTVDTPSPVIPGQNVNTKLTVADAQGHRLYWLYGYTDSTSPAGLPNEPTQATDPDVRLGKRLAGTANSAASLHSPIEADDWGYVTPIPHLLITDPAATVKVDRASVSLNDAYWNGYSWTVPADAVAGTWHAAFTLNTGVYQGAISTDQPFTVSALPAYTLATTASPTAGGSIGRSPDAASYTSGTVVMLTANVNAGYHFVNWSGDLTGTTNPATITMDGNKTVTAAFEANPFPDLTVDTLAFDPAQPVPGGSVALHFTVRNQGSAPVTADYAMDLYVDGAYVGTSLDTTKLASGSSQAWSWPRTWPSDTASHTFMVVLDPAGIIAESNESNNSASLSASAVPATYTLTTAASPSAGGSIGRSPDAATYASGTVVTLTANPALGYHFVNWSGDLTGSTNPTTVTMTGNKTVTAVFALTTGSYSLSLLPSWNVISVPFATPVSLLPTCDLFLAWDGSFWQPVTTLVPGTGYLVRNTAGTTTVPLTGLPSSSPQTQPATGTWQIIGNPYTTPACFTCTSVVPYLLFWDGTLWQLASPTNLPPGLGFLLQDSSPGTITLTRLP